jgi:hypothetical protein
VVHTSRGREPQAAGVDGGHVLPGLYLQASGTEEREGQF